MPNESAAPTVELPSTPAPDTATAGTPPAQPDLLGKIERASDRAIDSFAATAKRKPGQRGPDKNPRKLKPKVPVVPMGESSIESLLEEGQTTPLAVDWQASAPSIDDASAKAFAELGMEAFKEIRGTVVGFVAHRMTGDAVVSEAAVKPVNPKLEDAMVKAGTACVKEFAAAVDYHPAYTVLGGMAIIVVGDLLRLKMLKSEAQKVRQAQ